MDGKKTIVRNALWNWTGMATHMLVGILILPFLIQHLGESTYGLWIVIASLTSYFGVFDLGIGGSVGRNVAYCRARNDRAGVNGILSTAFFYLSSAGTLALLATFGVLLFFFDLIDVEPAQRAAAQYALLLVGVNFALSLPLQAFDGLLWAYQRFDLQNRVDIPAVLTRALLTWWLIGAGHGLVALAVITLLTNVAALAVKAALALRLEPGLRVSFALIERGSARALFGYGLWYFIFSIIKSLAPQLIVLIVGSRLGTLLVTPLTVATRLIGYANQFLIAGTGVLTPVATALHARADQEQQRSLLLAGGRGCLTLTLLFATLFAFLGRPLIRLWVKPELEFAYPLLMILIAGELLPMSQHISMGIILGKGRPRILAASSLVELGASATLALLLSREYGLTGVCIAAAIPACLCRGVCPLVYTCRAIGVRLTTYLTRALLPALATAALPALVLGLITLSWTPRNWPQLCLCGGAYALLYLAVAGVGLFGLKVWRKPAPSGADTTIESVTSAAEPIASAALLSAAPSPGEVLD